MIAGWADLKVGPYIAVVIMLCVGAGLQTGPLAQGLADAQRHGRVFKPQDLGRLESPHPDRWQKPQQIKDEKDYNAYYESKDHSVGYDSNRVP